MLILGRMFHLISFGFSTFPLSLARGIVVLLLAGALSLSACGEDLHFAISSDDYDDFEDCDSQCHDLCRSCHTFSSDILECIDFCEPRCDSADCDWDGYSFECEDIFRAACLL